MLNWFQHLEPKQKEPESHLNGRAGKSRLTRIEKKHDAERTSAITKKKEEPESSSG
ncbi:MAG: hypothetical protein AAFU57_10895 [Bacteroidota bacterium]